MYTMSQIIYQTDYTVGYNLQLKRQLSVYVAVSSTQGKLVIGEPRLPAGSLVLMEMYSSIMGRVLGLSLSWCAKFPSLLVY